MCGTQQGSTWGRGERATGNGIKKNWRQWGPRGKLKEIHEHTRNRVREKKNELPKKGKGS